MSWYTVAAAGGARDLWVRVTGPGMPQYGRWVSPAGHDVRKVLGQSGPRALDIEVWWAQEHDHRGDRLTDLLWETGMLGFKVMSRHMCDTLEGNGACLETFEDVAVRLADGSTVGDYVGVLEDAEQSGPVHSLWRGRRSHRFVVSEDVQAALVEARLSGLEFESVGGPFPADQPGYFDD